MCIRDRYKWFSDPDASEFKKNSDTYKIINDLSERWLATDNKLIRNYLHYLAEDARRLAREDTPYLYGQDKIMNELHKNAKLGLDQMETLEYMQKYGYKGTSSASYTWFRCV